MNEPVPETVEQPKQKHGLRWLANDIKNDFHNIAAHIRKAEKTE